MSRVAITDTLPLQRNVVLVPTAIHLDEVTVTARNEARQLREEFDARLGDDLKRIRGAQHRLLTKY